MKLTKTTIQNIADRLWDGTPGDRRSSRTSEEYMCFAAAHEASSNYLEETPPAFAKMIEDHGISSGGELENLWFIAPMDHAERQALRFDFLNLVAVSGAF